MKYLPDCWVIFLEQNIISATISMVTIVSCQLSMHMLKYTEGGDFRQAVYLSLIHI